MSFLLKLLRFLLCCVEDERGDDHGSYTQLHKPTSFNYNDYDYKASYRNCLPPPLTCSSNNPSQTSFKSTPSKTLLSASPYNPTSSSSLKPPASSSSFNTFSPSPKFPTSLSKVQQSSSVDPYSTFPKPPTSSSSLNPATSLSKPLQSSSVDSYSTFPKPPTSSSSLDPPKASSKPLQSSSVDSYSTFPKPPTSSSSLNRPKASSKPPQSSSVDSYSTFPKPPTSSSSLNPPKASSKPPQSSSFSTSSLSPHFPKFCEVPRLTSVNPSSSSAKLSTSLSQVEKSSSAYPYSASPKPPTSSSNPTRSSIPSPRPPTSSPQSSKLSTSNPKQPQSSSKPHRPSRKAARSSSKPSASSSFKQVLSPASSDAFDQKRKKNYNYVAKSSLPIYAIPEDIKDLIKNDIVPGILNKPLSPTTYKDYFAALLYAEEFYHEKWPHFDVENVTLAIHEASVHKNLEKEEKTFVEFDMASFPKDRPFLLSRDFVYVQPSGTEVEPFEGIIHRIVRSRIILVEFEDDFYFRHDPSQKYDVSFSFNRVCLKRAHQAVQTASNALFRNFLFPDCISRTSTRTAPERLPQCHKLDRDQLSVVRQILSIRGSPPYLVSGDLCVERNIFRTSRTGNVVSQAVYQLFQASLKNRILICAPSNRCCDGLMRRLLKGGIQESDMFRANAAFREKEEVPEEILPSCLYKNTCFSCPPIERLRKFRVIFSTFMSSFRLHDKGITAGHFSHIFLVDASSAIEPEALVTLTSFADEDTTVIVTGAPGNDPHWVRSDMARKNGLKTSYFERLHDSMP